MNFYLKQRVSIVGEDYTSYGIIQGKLKSDAYVIFIQSVSKMKTMCRFWGYSGEGYKALKNKYGCPIRHMELEWGKFMGTDKEIIVPAEDISL